MTKTWITSKGQTTVPVAFRRTWRTRAVIWEACEDGSARVRPVTDVMQLFGAVRDGRPRDPDEMRKARAALGHRGKRA